MTGDTITLTKDLLETAAELFDQIEENQIADGAIRHALESFPDNDNPVGVCMKAVLINALYQTVIFDIIRLAHHIVKQGIDPKLRAADLSVINDIRFGHGIGNKGKNKERDFYSFATKYAHFHKPDSYPIYDNLVMRLLSEANRKIKFHGGFTQSQLKDYSVYKSVVDSLAQYLNIPASWKYKKIDQGLWIYAKYRYRKENEESLPSDVVQRLKKAERG
jgi:hypothetical protein